VPLAADPKVDYAFKRVFGDPRNADILIHLLNAILRPQPPIRSIEILNPFSDKDFADDKLSVLDIRARDQQGQLFDIEMQLLLPHDFKGRILYYWAGMFHGQLRDGDDYINLRPAISICLVNQELFPEIDDYHLAFELIDVEHNARFTDLIEVHVLQLPKLVQGPDELRDDLEGWLYLFRHPESIDEDHLPARINQPIYMRAIKELEMLTKDEQERLRYEARVKAARDRRAFAEDAKRAMERGLQQGEYIGRIHFGERVLGRPQTPSDDLVQLSLDELQRRATALETEVMQDRAS
jgi:predicted transposase/invertase (TIGR01784 family)